MLPYRSQGRSTHPLVTFPIEEKSLWAFMVPRGKIPLPLPMDMKLAHNSPAGF
ncbi:MAG: hypothetical protein A4E36_01446 [Methanoregulaceae archaeon PtaB.Bin009]|nr:MAG: hypothetical protein A4E36_01446 [Methanoregulaceae archaeon PtaB.Bin009]